MFLQARKVYLTYIYYLRFLNTCESSNKLSGSYPCIGQPVWVNNLLTIFEHDSKPEQDPQNIFLQSGSRRHMTLASLTLFIMI